MASDDEQRLPRSGVFKGMVAGDARVVAGSDLTVRGMIAGDLIVEAGATARVEGMVGGRVIDEGAEVSLGGMIGRH